MRPVRIVVVLSGFPRRSETFALGELLALDDAGMLAAVFATKPGDGLPLQPGADRIAGRVELLPSTSVEEQAEFIVRRVADTPVDGIHGYFAHTPAEVAALAARRLNVPFGWSAHARDVRKVSASTLAARARAAACVIACNPDVAQELERAGAPVRLVPHGVDVRRFRPEISPAPTGEPLRLLAVGRLVEKKGFGTLIKAVARTRCAVRLRVIGEGPEHTALTQLIAEFGLCDKVELPGSRTHEELPTEYAHCDAFVAPSIIDSEGDRDGLPNVVLEAMASGRPVVGSNLLGIAAAVEPGVTGILVPPGNTEALRDAIESLAKDPMLRQRLGRGARQRSEAQWDVTRCTRRWLACLEEAYGRRASLQSEATPQGTPVIAYIMKGYPRRSEPFIASEIRHLEELGSRIRVFAIRGLSEPGATPAAGLARAPVSYLPESDANVDTSFFRWTLANGHRFLGAHVRLLVRHPLRYLRTLGEAAAASVRYRSGWLGLKRVFFKDFLRAGAIADAVLRDPTIRHLHAHFCHGSTTMAMFASTLTGLPFSFTAHAKDIYLPKLNPGDLLARKIRRARFVATCTEANRTHLRGLCPESTSIQTIYHGLDPSIFRVEEASRAAADSLPTVLAVGRFVEKKGFGHLVEACRILKARGSTQGLRFRCRIIGERGEQSEVIAGAVRDAGLEDWVSLEGPVSQAELRAVYRAATVFVLPCRVVENGDRDGIPNVLVEAMALELPVISTDVSGIPELLEHRVNGLLVPPSAPTALADAIEELLRDGTLRRVLAAAGRRTVEQRFDARRTTRELQQLFEATLTQGGIVRAPVLFDFRASAAEGPP